MWKALLIYCVIILQIIWRDRHDWNLLTQDSFEIVILTAFLVFIQMPNIHAFFERREEREFIRDIKEKRGKYVCEKRK